MHQNLRLSIPQRTKFIFQNTICFREQLNLVCNTGTPGGIASTDRVVGGVSTTLMPETVFAINLDDDHIQLGIIYGF